MNAYEQKQAARRERMEARAERAANESAAAFQASRSAVEAIPFGQPILVGHHSESRHRAAIARSDAAMRRAVEADDKAKHYERAAAAVGTGGVSSDDPDALDKLRAQLATAEACQANMKAANRVVKSKKTDDQKRAALVASGYSEDAAADLLKPDFCGRVGFAAYQLSNNNANITRLRKRIEELEQRRSRAPVELEGNGYTYREDVDENRVMFEFDGKPAEAVRDLLKRHAFKWSPSRGAWVRQLSAAGIYAGQQVREALDKLQGN